MVNWGGAGSKRVVGWGWVQKDFEPLVGSHKICWGGGRWLQVVVVCGVLKLCPSDLMAESRWCGGWVLTVNVVELCCIILFNRDEKMKVEYIGNEAG